MGRKRWCVCFAQSIQSCIFECPPLGGEGRHDQCRVRCHETQCVMLRSSTRRPVIPYPDGWQVFSHADAYELHATSFRSGWSSVSIHGGDSVDELWLTRCYVGWSSIRPKRGAV